MPNSDFESLRALAREAEETKKLAQKLYDKILSNLRSKTMATVLEGLKLKSAPEKTHD